MIILNLSEISPLHLIFTFNFPFILMPAVDEEATDYCIKEVKILYYVFQAEGSRDFVSKITPLGLWWRV